MSSPKKPSPPGSSPSPGPETLAISPTGRVDLPEWVCKRLLKDSRVRSKKFRVQKKVIKREFMRLLWKCVDPDSIAPKNPNRKVKE